MVQVAVDYARQENPSPWAKLTANAGDKYYL